MFRFEGVFPSALTGQTVKLAAQDSINLTGLFCIPAFLFGNFFFALTGPWFLCSKEKYESIRGRVLLKSSIEALCIVAHVIAALSSSASILIVAFVAGWINGFHSRCLSQAVAFMTGRIASLGTELGLKLRGSSTFSFNKMTRQLISYSAFLAGACSTRIIVQGSARNLKDAFWVFHIKFLMEMLALIILQRRNSVYLPRVAYSRERQNAAAHS